MDIGSRIREARKNKNLTLEELGALCGATKQAIYKYENNIVTNIPLSRLEKIAFVLGVSAAYLMGWTDDKEKAPGGQAERSAKEKELVQVFSRLSEKEQDFILNNMEALLKLKDDTEQ